MRPGPSIASSLALPLTTSFAGAQTLWWLTSTSTPPRIVLLFIPGNPGLSSYYIDFLHSIYTSLPSSSGVEILSVAHRGHAPLPPVGTNAVWGDNFTNQTQAARGYGVSLGDQVRHKIAVLDAIRRQYPEKETKVVLVGHSIGAWIVGEVIKARPGAVQGAHLLFPTLAWIGRTPNARKIRVLMNPVSRVVLWLPLLVLSLLPLWALVWLIRLLTGQPGAAALATAELLTTKGAVYNALSMAKEEFSTVQGLGKDTIEALNSFTQDGGAIRSYWEAEENDSWAPSWIRSQVETELSLQRVNLPPSLGLGSAPRNGSVSEGKKGRSRTRTRSFSVSEYRSSPGSIPDLRNAKAIRKPNGEIVIEAEVPNSSSEDEEEEREGVRGNGNRGVGYHLSKSKATSTHCRVGMPHAFCLNYSEEMAKVVAHWIQFDHFREGKQK